MGAIGGAKAFRLETDLGVIAFPKVTEAVRIEGHGEAIRERGESGDQEVTEGTFQEFLGSTHTRPGMGGQAGGQSGPVVLS